VIDGSAFFLVNGGSGPSSSRGGARKRGHRGSGGSRSSKRLRRSSRYRRATSEDVENEVFESNSVPNDVPY